MSKFNPPDYKDMPVMARNEAKAGSHKYYFSGKKCLNGNLFARLSSTGNCQCPPCMAAKKQQKKKYYQNVKTKEWYIDKIKRYQDLKKDEKREYDRRYRDATREKQKQWSDAWAAKNPDKIRASKHNYKVKRRVAEKAGIPHGELTKWIKGAVKVCYWCGKDCKQTYQVDHYQPLARGGDHKIENLVIACATCNNRKKARDPYEFAQKEMGKLF